VNKNLRRIAYSKQIWIYLIDYLAAKGLIDLPHDRPLQEYSTAELIEEVQRIVLGPKTWSRQRRLSPLIALEFRIPRTRPDGQPKLFSVQLLPGGTHLVVEYTSRIELWHVAASAVIWFLEDNWTTRVCRYSIELCDDQRSASLATLDTPYLLRLIRIDLSTGGSTEIFKVEPPSQYPHFGCRPVICGDFFGCVLESWANHCFMVGNWRTEKTVIINYNPHAEAADWLVGTSLNIFLLLLTMLPPSVP
jgi:hypothetical protein